MGSTVATECLSEHMTALEDFAYQLVTISLRLIAEVLGLGLFGVYEMPSRSPGGIGGTRAARATRARAACAGVEVSI
jgi:hypothetical protein